jgi:hypothetical protein
MMKHSILLVGPNNVLTLLGQAWLISSDGPHGSDKYSVLSSIVAGLKRQVERRKMQSSWIKILQEI